MEEGRKLEFIFNVVWPIASTSLSLSIVREMSIRLGTINYCGIARFILYFVVGAQKG